MLFALMSVLLSTANAQAPIVVGANSDKEVVYVAQGDGVVTKRFITDTEAAGAKLGAGDAVTVLFREDGMVRVRKGDVYGWVPEAAVTTEAPPTPTPTINTPITIPAFPPQ